VRPFTHPPRIARFVLTRRKNPQEHRPMPLARVLEPEVMDTPQEALDYDAMDHSHVNRLFVANLLEIGDIGSRILDLGAGTAQIPIELCRNHADCRILAGDLSIPMLEQARLNVEVAGLIERIELRHVDAKRLPFTDQAFSTVMSNSIVHHIPQPATVLAEAVRVVMSGGWIFFRDLLRPDSEAERQRLVATYATDCNAHQRQMFADSLHAALTLDEIRQLVAQLGFDPHGVQATSDRHWTWCVRKP
jgi:ubiquinone/menaquinone biosynthesis C-methylase UbiE